MSRGLSRFSPASLVQPNIESQGNKLKLFLKFSKIAPLHFSFPFNLNGTNGW